MSSYAYSFLDLCLLDIFVGDALFNGLQSGIFTDLYHWLGSHFPTSRRSSSNLGSPFPFKVKFDFYLMINWERSKEILCDYLRFFRFPFSPPFPFYILAVSHVSQFGLKRVTCYVIENDLEPLILLPQLPKCYDYRYDPVVSRGTVDWTQGCMLDKHS